MPAVDDGGPEHRADAPVDAPAHGGGEPEPEQARHLAVGDAGMAAVESSTGPGGADAEDTEPVGPEADDSVLIDAERTEIEPVVEAVKVPTRPSQVTVEDGETMESIAARWAVDPAELAGLNAWLTPNSRYLFPGQVLRLPRGSGGPITRA
ncbi:LysM peptidoglycan-binding domain-containing protein [Arthrobacter sp. NPDC090010]|uniref:LysM peptidoglycan-binding domain-containing protein n=1 Tax=Arthrobacter sp. NPDC090010 TaxID=3363942 RepID=UPI0037FCCD34